MTCFDECQIGVQSHRHGPSLYTVISNTLMPIERLTTGKERIFSEVLDCNVSRKARWIAYTYLFYTSPSQLTREIEDGSEDLCEPQAFCFVSNGLSHVVYEIGVEAAGQTYGRGENRSCAYRHGLLKKRAVGRHGPLFVKPCKPVKQGLSRSDYKYRVLLTFRLDQSRDPQSRVFHQVFLTDGDGIATSKSTMEVMAYFHTTYIHLSYGIW